MEKVSPTCFDVRFDRLFDSLTSSLIHLDHLVTGCQGRSLRSRCQEDFLGFLEEATKTPEKFELTETDEIKAVAAVADA